MRGILQIESWPSAPDRVEEYNRWYDEEHLPEVVAIDGIVSARRFEPVDDDGPFVAQYELDTDDLSAVLPRLIEAFGSGAIKMSDAIQLDPYPTVRLLRLTTTYSPE